MMVRVYDAHPHPDELADLRNDDKPPRWDVALFAVAVVLVAVLCIALALPAIRAVIEVSADRPAACMGLTVSDCAARASEGW